MKKVVIFALILGVTGAMPLFGNRATRGEMGEWWRPELPKGSYFDLARGCAYACIGDNCTLRCDDYGAYGFANLCSNDKDIKACAIWDSTSSKFMPSELVCGECPWGSYARRW